MHSFINTWGEGAPAWPMRRFIGAGISLLAVGLVPSEDGTTTSALRPQRLEGRRVLVVEDDPDARDMLTTILLAEGAVVESADSASAGFAAYLAFRPELLISDIAMPGEDGYSLMRRVRALAADAGGSAPAIALTAFTRPEDRSRALSAGFTKHVSKPISPRELVPLIVTLLASVGA